MEKKIVMDKSSFKLVLNKHPHIWNAAGGFVEEVLELI